MSNINYLGINENFPVAGQDNDTQVFRDNFDTIKSSLRAAQQEVIDLEQNKASLDEDNDFGYNKIQKAVLQNNFIQKNPQQVIDGTIGDPITIDHQSGGYQIFKLGRNVTFDFKNFPGDPNLLGNDLLSAVGKVTIELYGDGTPRIANFITSGSGADNIKKDPGFPSTVTVTSADDPVFIEIWRHDTENIYMRYLGQYTI